MTSIDGVRSEGHDTHSALSDGSRPKDGVPAFVTRVARAWKAGSVCIPAGLVGSLLTCIASVGVNLLIDSRHSAFPAALYLRKLSTGYAAAASVVVAVFPLLPLMTRRFRNPAPVETTR